MSNTRLKNAKSNIKSGLMSNLLSVFLPFLIRTVMINVLGAEYLGLNSLFTSILQVLNMAELGFSNAIVFSLYKPLANHDESTICALMALYRKVYKTIGVIIFIAGLMLMPCLKYLIKGSYPDNINLHLVYFVNLINIVISYLLFAYKGALLSADQKQSEISKINMVLLILRNIIQIVILYYMKNYYLFLIINILYTCAYNIWIARVVNKNYPTYICCGQLEKQQKFCLIQQIKGVAIGKLSFTARNAFDIIVISMFCGLVASTKYSNYYYVFSAALGLILVLGQAITASIGNSIAIESTDKNYNNFLKLNFYFNWIGSWFTICLFCLYQPFMKLWMGENLLLSNRLVVLFCVYFYITQIGQLRSVYSAAAGIWWELRYLQICEMIANLLMNFILGYFYGIAGVLWATIITMLFFTLCGQTFLLYKIYFKKSSIEYFLIEIYYTVIFIFAAFLTQKYCMFSYIGGFPPFFYKIIICIIIPNIIFFAVTCLNKKHRKFLWDAINEMKNINV